MTTKFRLPDKSAIVALEYHARECNMDIDISEQYYRDYYMVVITAPRKEEEKEEEKEIVEFLEKEIDAIIESETEIDNILKTVKKVFRK